MTTYDFVVTNRQTKGNTLTLTAEKVTVLDDDVTLDSFLKEKGVSDENIGHAIEQLEAIPYGASEVTIAGLNGNIIIKQP